MKMKKNEMPKNARLVPLKSFEESLFQSRISEFLTGSESKTPRQVSDAHVPEPAKSSNLITPSGWIVSFSSQAQSIKEATEKAASSAEKPNSAPTSSEMSQNPGTSIEDVRKSGTQSGKNQIKTEVLVASATSEKPRIPNDKESEELESSAE